MFTYIWNVVFATGFMLTWKWQWAAGAYIAFIIYDIIKLLCKIINERLTIRSLRKVLVEKRKKRNN